MLASHSVEYTTQLPINKTQESKKLNGKDKVVTFREEKRKKKKAFKGKMSPLLNVARVRGKGDHSEDHGAVPCHI